MPRTLILSFVCLALMFSFPLFANGTGIYWRGQWSNVEVYNADDAVSHDGSSYIALATSTSVAPGSDPSKWNLLAQAGTSINWRGPWSSMEVYNASDAIAYEGSSFIALATSTGVTPGTDVFKWSLVAQRGTDGAPGPQGPQGLQGATGATGPQGPTGLNLISTTTATSFSSGAIPASNGSTMRAATSGDITALLPSSYTYSGVLQSNQLGVGASPGSTSLAYFQNGDVSKQTIGALTQFGNGTHMVNPYRPYWFKTYVNSTDLTPSTFLSTGVNSTLYFGLGGVPTKGTAESGTFETVVQGNGDDMNEHGSLFGVLRYDLGPGFIQTSGSAGRAWFADFNLHGPIGIQPHLLNGVTMFTNNYYNGSPKSGPSGGMWVVTKQGQGGGNENNHQTAATYPMDVGLGIVGDSYANNATGYGFKTALQIGGYGGGWMWAGLSKIQRGITIKDFTDYGILINNRFPSATGPAIAIDSNGGPVAIGATTATEKLEVTGNIKINGLGNGLKFPDGSIQTTANTGSSGSVTQANVLSAIATQTDGALLSIWQGPSEGATTKKFKLLDSAGNTRVFIDPRGHVDSNNNLADSSTAMTASKTLSSVSGGQNYASLYGRNSVISSNNTDSGLIIGGIFDAIYSGSGSASLAGELRAVLGTSYNNGSTPVDNMLGVGGGGGALGTGNVTNLKCFKTLPYSPGTGAITNLYGYYSDVSEVSRATNKWHFYGVGNSPSYFGGSIGIGTATPAQMLEVNGKGQFDDQILAANGSVSAPGISMINDPTSGFYLISARKWGLGIGSSNIAIFDNSGTSPVTSFSGTVTASSFAGDTSQLIRKVESNLTIIPTNSDVITYAGTSGMALFPQTPTLGKSYMFWKTDTTNLSVSAYDSGTKLNGVSGGTYALPQRQWVKCIYVGAAEGWGCSN